MNEGAPRPPASPGGRLVAVLAIASGVGVANIYYVQPLLPKIAAAFGTTPAAVGYVPMLTQLGFAAGLLLFIPLGDVVDRKRLILALVAGAAAALLAVTAAQGLVWLAAASFAVGLTSVVPHVAVPLAAHLAAPSDRGRVIGFVLSGILVGILLARTVAGFLGEALGWRAVFAIAAAGTVSLGAVLVRALPHSPPPASIPYRALMASVVSLASAHRELREAALIAAAGFAAFSAIWATLAFFLAGPPHFHGSDVAGLFGLLGALGALAAPVVGRIADRYGARAGVGLAFAIELVSFGVFAATGSRIWGLALGVALLDVGWQSGHVSNLARIHTLDPEARSRLTTVYMGALFSGGALGTWVGAHAWAAAGWTGVSVSGAAFSAIALLAWARGWARERAAPPDA
ncbi:MAG TPA: MFS transporter [Anaeromyxobacter sp.]